MTDETPTQQPTDLIDRVARAMWCEMTHGVDPWPWTDDRRNPPEARMQRLKYRRMASAAIREIAALAMEHDFTDPDRTPLFGLATGDDDREST